MPGRRVTNFWRKGSETVGERVISCGIDKYGEVIIPIQLYFLPLSLQTRGCVASLIPSCCLGRLVTGFKSELYCYNSELGTMYQGGPRYVLFLSTLHQRCYEDKLHWRPSPFVLFISLTPLPLRLFISNLMLPTGYRPLNGILT